jgi:hypothetical protein
VEFLKSHDTEDAMIRIEDPVEGKDWVNNPV